MVIIPLVKKFKQFYAISSLHFWFSILLAFNSCNDKMETENQVHNFMLSVGKNKMVSAKIVKNVLILKNRPIYVTIKLTSRPVLT